jgi:hypothetical protein
MEDKFMAVEKTQSVSSVELRNDKSKRTEISAQLANLDARISNSTVLQEPTSKVLQDTHDCIKDLESQVNMRLDPANITRLKPLQDIITPAKAKNTLLVDLETCQTRDCTPTVLEICLKQLRETDIINTRMHHGGFNLFETDHPMTDIGRSTFLRLYGAPTSHGRALYKAGQVCSRSYVTHFRNGKTIQHSKSQRCHHVCAVRISLPVQTCVW